LPVASGLSAGAGLLGGVGPDPEPDPEPPSAVGVLDADADADAVEVAVLVGELVGVGLPDVDDGVLVGVGLPDDDGLPELLAGGEQLGVDEPRGPPTPPL